MIFPPEDWGNRDFNHIFAKKTPRNPPKDGELDANNYSHMVNAGREPTHVRSHFGLWLH